MLRENALTVTAARLAGIPFRLLARRPLQPPHKLLILRPCCLSQVMLATPLLASLSEAYPRAQIDWAVSEWARPGVASNPRISELIDTGRVGLPDATWADVRALVARLRQERYDTCIIPSRSSLLSWVAWRANIPQRVGLNQAGRGFAHTVAVKVPAGVQHESLVYLSLAQAFGIAASAPVEFFPSDAARSAVTRRLVDEIDWLGDVPLVIMHPGGGENPVRTDSRKRWPVERFALLGNDLVRNYRARVLLVGAEVDRPLAQAVSGLMPSAVANLVGRLKLDELGALCEVADLYVGNDAGSTHVAAAVGCPTLAIYGPSNPARSGPFAPPGRVRVLWAEWEQPFSWRDHVLPDEAAAAAAALLRRAEEKRGG